MYTLGTKNLKDTSSWHSIQVLHNYILILGSFQTFILVLSSWLMVLGLVVVIAAIISFDFYMLSTTTNTRPTDILNPQKSQTKMTTLFRKKRFMLDEMFQWNTSKFAIFHIYENPKSFFPFHSTLFFPLMNALALVYVDNRHRPGQSLREKIK